MQNPVFNDSLSEEIDSLFHDQDAREGIPTSPITTPHSMSKLISCRVCGKQFSPRAKACPGCGEPNALRACPECGYVCSHKAVSCPKCGCPFSTTPPQKIVTETADKNSNVVNVVVGSSAIIGEKQGVIASSPAAAPVVAAPVIVSPSYKTCNKWVSFCLCFFLGWLGAHRFYEEKYISGIIYFFTAGLIGIGVIVDLIIILMRPEEYQP